MVGRIFLGRYETMRILGEGGMGRVYLARQLDLGRQVVVKVMHDQIAADPHFRDRFQRETLLMARFQHPYAVTLYDASLNDPEGPCIIMEYIRGGTLDGLLAQNGRLSAAICIASASSCMSCCAANCPSQASPPWRSCWRTPTPSRRPSPIWAPAIGSPPTSKPSSAPASQRTPPSDQPMRASWSSAMR